MNEENTQKTIQELVKEEASSYDLDFLDFDFEQDLESFIDDVKSQEERVFEQDIIYYSNAIEYLKENDPSLRESLEIASEYGYSPENLNSELLATLLYQKELLENFGYFISFLEDIDEEERKKDCYNEEEDED